MTAAVLPDVDIDPALVASMTPPCELIKTNHSYPGSRERCTDPACWVLRVRFDCGTEMTVLMCDNHAAEISAHIWSMNHGDQPQEPYSVLSMERL